MFTDRTGSGGRRCRLAGLTRVAGVIGCAAIVVSACGGSTATPSASTPAASPLAPSTAASAQVPSAAPSDAGYTGPAATISYSIWGDPAEIKNQQAVVDAFHVANPK